MSPPSIPSADPDRRRQPRAILWASALIMPKDRRPTEHMIYDLSAGGARLCGVPEAEVGDRVRVALHLPRTTVRASGRLLRVGDAQQEPEFAIEFSRLRLRAEAAIHEAVEAVLLSRAERLILLVQGDEGREWAGWSWLEPLCPMCRTATTLPDAFEHLDRRAIEVGLVCDQNETMPPISRWAWAFPQVWWRTIDRAGRLFRAPADPYGLPARGGGGLRKRLGSLRILAPREDTRP